MADTDLTPKQLALIQGLYDQPPRAYHNWSHVLACRDEFAGVRGHCVDPAAVELALLFHDAVYDVRRHDNEEQAATLAREWLSRWGVGESVQEEVGRLILATKHAAAPHWNDGRIIVDIDLAILGKPLEEFDSYEQAIREEYSFVPEEAFAGGRAEILTGFLSRPSIYLTVPFRERYEAAARANLLRSIERLRGL